MSFMDPDYREELAKRAQQASASCTRNIKRCEYCAHYESCRCMSSHVTEWITCVDCKKAIDRGFAPPVSRRGLDDLKERVKAAASAGTLLTLTSLDAQLLMKVIP